MQELDGPFLFAEDADQSVHSSAISRWRCLIVDDDEGVHQSVVFAMHNLTVSGGEIEWLHAYSAGEARTILESEPNIAVVLLDVVMEHEHAGLDLVRTIRRELGCSDTRIVLHTGQPGFAPEITAIRDYDINDYRTKSELTRNHIYTCLASAIRTYRQIRSIESSRIQLRRIIQSADALMSQNDDTAFSRGVLDQFAEMLRTGSSGLAIWRMAGTEGGTARCLYAAGVRAAEAGLSLQNFLDADMRALCVLSMDSRQTEWNETGVALSIAGRDGCTLTIYLDTAAGDRREIDATVLETFAAHVAACMDNRALVARLHHDAFHDRLLDLPNRRRLSDLLDAAYLEFRDGGNVLALVDIDQFGEINEALGQAFGDALLLAFGERLCGSLCPKALVARVSADVFAVFGPEQWLMPLRLLGIFAAPLLVLEEETMVSVTIGITLLGDVEARTGAAALEASFHALRLAKTSQRGQLAWYSPELARKTHERVNLLNGLRRAVRAGQLFVVYQPQIALSGRRLIGLEALVRWRTESSELIGPDRFIPVAEQSGLIREIGYFVLREACAALATLLRDGGGILRMAVNVSAIQFRQPAFVHELREIIAGSGIDPGCLELEITESIAMEDAVYVRETLDALHAMGVQLAVDDFGTGYSSLAQLKGMAFDRLKIDKAFVSDLSSIDTGASIAGVVIQLGQRLGKEVIAEGVETEEQAELLSQMGCREAQGYLFALPMPLDELRSWISQHAEC